jgi:hypothetical protein
MTQVRRRGDAVELTLSAGEGHLLRMFAELVATFLAPVDPTPPATDPLEAMMSTSTEPVETPQDPALLRLLPDAYGDAAAAGEFRRLMESDLRRQKIDALETVQRALSDAGGPDLHVAIAGDDVETWLQALNDIRLFLGSRLEVTEDFYEQIDELDPEDPRLPQLLAYDWLGFIQEALLRTLD